MTVIFSKRCEYGLQAVLYLSILEEGKTASAEEISKIMHVPKEFVSKTLQSLALKKIVSSKKGNSGGFFLGKPASQIKLIEIVEAIDGLSLFQNCVLGFEDCSCSKPCPVHKKWGPLREKAFNMLSIETLEHLKKKSIKKIKSLNQISRKTKESIC